MTECPCCGHESETCYRCDECGKDLTGETSTAGREGANA
jgi:uncharacterized membrane protein YvbJ